MKKNKLNKKLSLKKETIADLRMDILFGGTPSDSECPECQQDRSQIPEYCSAYYCEETKPLNEYCFTYFEC